MNIFEEANCVLDNFINKHLDSYHHLRNYDFGAENRSNVSQISKYTSHRIIYEYDLIEKIKKLDKKKKFTDEVIWRIYWKGYLENYKSIWYQYINFRKKPINSNIMNSALEGNTGISCFDTWIEELRENNYLHNHSRMWFASIWIFKLRLPWQIGARLFMKHLLDGDAASNTLSWRWVAGMHTNKKPYIASKNNIYKYTYNRFRNLTFTISPKIDEFTTKKHQPNLLPVQRDYIHSNILIMFDNDLNIKNRYNLFNSYSKIYILFNGNSNTDFELSKKVIDFKLGLIQSVNNIISNSIILKSTEIDNLLSNHNCIDVIYPGIGHNLDLINKYALKKQLNVNFIYRDEDLIYWNYSKSGFYKFKKSFYKHNNLSVH